MTNHTPGPWKADCNRVKTTRGIIADCPVPQKGGVFDCGANARLIAAAPDMLAGLKELLASLRHLEQYGPGSTDLSGFLVGLPILIAKAEGSITAATAERHTWGRMESRAGQDQADAQGRLISETQAAREGSGRGARAVTGGEGE